MKEEYNYFWHCPVCKTPEQKATSLDDAQLQAQAHEKATHKGKMVANFGKERKIRFAFLKKLWSNIIFKLKLKLFKLKLIDTL